MHYYSDLLSRWSVDLCSHLRRKTMDDKYEMTLTDTQWWCYDIPGNIGWIIWIVCNCMCLSKGLEFYPVISLIPSVLMLIGVIELISERIAKLARILPKNRLYRGFGALTLGGILGVPVSVIGIVEGIEESRPLWMLAGAVLCGLFAGLCFKGYRKVENIETL